MATKKSFIDGKPEPITPVTNNQIVEDNTPGKMISSEALDYNENEHSDDIATLDVACKEDPDKSKHQGDLKKEKEVVSSNTDLERVKVDTGGEDEES